MNLNTVKSLLEVERYNFLRLKKIREIQSRKLQSLIHYSYHNVPFYRRLWDRAGVQINKIKTPQDLAKLPIVYRRDVQNAPIEDLLARGFNPKNCVARKTGGSTDRPLTIYSTKESLEYEALIWLRSWRKCGLKLTDRQATIRDATEHHHAKRNKWLKKMGILRIQYLDLYETPEDLTHKLLQNPPDILRGHPSIISAISQQSEAITIQPRLIFTSGENLTPHKEAIYSAFRKPVIDFYGATESGCIAWFCEDCGCYHLNSDSVLIEVDGENRGKIFITNLFSYAMPFIRYSLGDVLEICQNKCPKSPETISIKKILGREIENLLLPDGKLVASPYLFMIDDVPGVSQYKIIEDHPGKIRIFVVKKNGFCNNAMTICLNKMQAYTGDQCQISVDFVNHIPDEN